MLRVRTLWRQHKSAIRVIQIDRIIRDIGVEVDLIVVSDRIRLQEPPERRRIDPRLVVVHAELGEPRLAGIAEAADAVRLNAEAALVRDAPGVVAGDGDRGAGGVGRGDDRALVVGVEIAAAEARGVLVPELLPDTLNSARSPRVMSCFST